MPPIAVDEETLRRMFNEGRYYERALAGEFRVNVVYDSPAGAASRQPKGTKSQILEYWDKYGRRIATMHQFRLPSGLLGASGRPDPKSLVVDGVEYVIER
jgi:hypothetical protein